ncbi:MAG: hypothetical protein AAF934_05390 [Bacteroidota bacterium]
MNTETKEAKTGLNYKKDKQKLKSVFSDFMSKYYDITAGFHVLNFNDSWKIHFVRDDMAIKKKYDINGDVISEWQKNDNYQDYKFHLKKLMSEINDFITKYGNDIAGIQILKMENFVWSISFFRKDNEWIKELMNEN